MKYKDVFEYQKAYPNKAERERVLRSMSNEDIDKLVKTCGTPQGKNYYSKFKKK